MASNLSDKERAAYPGRDSTATTTNSNNNRLNQLCLKRLKHSINRSEIIITSNNFYYTLPNYNYKVRMSNIC